MNASTPAALRRIHVLSRLLAHGCLLLIVLLPIAVLAYWLTADHAALAVHTKLSGLSIEQPLATWQRVLGAVIVLFPLGLLLTGLWNARRCFQAFAAGRYFELAVIDRLRRFAAWTCASVGAGLLSTPALSVMLTVYNSPGRRQLSIGFGSDQLFTLFIAGMVWLIAAVMTQACALAEENAQFI